MGLLDKYKVSEDKIFTDASRGILEKIIARISSKQGHIIWKDSRKYEWQYPGSVIGNRTSLE